MNYYPFHPGDYLRDTVHLEPLEDLAYRRLLDLYYLSESPIPLETQSVSRRLRLGSESVSNVLNEFFTRTENGYVHKRCEAEIAAYRHRADRARVNGKAGGRPKNQRIKPSRFPAGTQQEPSGNPEQTQSKANQNQNQNQKSIPSEYIMPFNSEQFRQTWADWQQSRREQRKPLTPTAAKAQLAMLAKHDEQTAIAMLQQSIQNQYQGIFPLKDKGKPPTRPTRPCDESDVDWRNMKEL